MPTALDPQRISLIASGLSDALCDALIVATNQNVLLCTGYWPVVSTSIAIVTRDRQTALVAPEDEKPFLAGNPTPTHFYATGSLNKLGPLTDFIHHALAEALAPLKLQNARIALECGAHQTSSYVATHDFGPTLTDMLQALLPNATFTDATTLLYQLRAAKTPYEIDRIRKSAQLAARAYERAPEILRAAPSEIDAALRAEHLLFTDPQAARDQPHARAAGHFFCMSGQNAVSAYKDFQHSSHAPISKNAPTLLHANTSLNGYWTDITRTYIPANAPDEHHQHYAAILEARSAALSQLKPGAKAADIDHAARECLASKGFSKQFKHPLGHGVGFSAIDHHAFPRLHPVSPDTLTPGMIFNLEPGLYFENAPNSSGLRHCDMLLITHDSYELLTPFQPPTPPL